MFFIESFLEKSLHSYKHLKLCLFFFLVNIFLFSSYFFFQLGGIHDDVLGDFDLYLKVAQAIDAGGILYKDVLDIKNMGFHLFFFLFYKVYTLIFHDLSKISLYAHVFLIFIYTLHAFFVYSILFKITKKQALAIFSALIYLCYLSILEHAYIVNQPQITQIIFLSFLFYQTSISSERLNYQEYFCTGLFLGALFACATPYFIFVFSVPILAGILDPSLKEWFKSCLSAAVGFLLALVPFVFYFIYYNALSEWIYWNYTFLYVYDQYGLQMSIPFIKAFIGIFFTLSHLFQTPAIFAFNVGALSLWFCAVYKIIRKGVSFKSLDIRILFFCSLSFLTRLLLEKHHSSYNIYLMPFLIIAPAIFLNRNYLGSKIRNTVLVCLTIWILWVLKFPASFDDTLQYPKYDVLTATIIHKNSDKYPTFLSSERGRTYSYSKSWKSLGYLSHISPARFIFKYQPEVVLADNFVKDDYLSRRKELTSYEKNFLEEYPLVEDINFFIQKKYTQVSSIMYINNNQLKNWDLSVQITPESPHRKRLKFPDHWREILTIF